MAKIKPFERHTRKYEEWFQNHIAVYVSEVHAIGELIPKGKKGIEIGIGSGLFANPVGIKDGVEPSKEMRKLAELRDLNVVDGVAENLPIPDKSYDFALMVTTICFLDDIQKSFLEIHRILKDDGFFLAAFVDKESELGEKYLEFKNQNVFYKIAKFYSTAKVKKLLQENGFSVAKIVQTVFGDLEEIHKIQKSRTGSGSGGFVIIKATKTK